MRDFSRYKASALALIASNLLPLFGVLFLSWDTFEIVVLYWIENVVIGAINVLKMATCRPNPAELDRTQFASEDDYQQFRKIVSGRQHAASKLFFIPFFMFHYGLFCFVHGEFVVLFLAPESFRAGPPSVYAVQQLVSERHLWWAVLALAASHLYSYLVNYLVRGEYRRTVVQALMVRPYGRVILLHLAIIFGMWLVILLGSYAGVLAILVIVKTVIDLELHLAERRRNEGRTSAGSSDAILSETPIDEPRKSRSIRLKDRR
jgi:hypothetical protein